MSHLRSGDNRVWHVHSPFLLFSLRTHLQRMQKEVIKHLWKGAGSPRVQLSPSVHTHNIANASPLKVTVFPNVRLMYIMHTQVSCLMFAIWTTAITCNFLSSQSGDRADGAASMLHTSGKHIMSRLYKPGSCCFLCKNPYQVSISCHSPRWQLVVFSLSTRSSMD